MRKKSADILFLEKELEALEPLGPTLAQAALTLILLERSLRVAVGVRAEGKTLRTLLLQATDSRSGFLQFQGSNTALFSLSDFRNVILHGDFEEGARLSGSASVEVYVQERLPALLNEMHVTARGLLDQLNAL